MRARAITASGRGRVRHEHGSGQHTGSLNDTGKNDDERRSVSLLQVEIRIADQCHSRCAAPEQ
jgi:hypothetical protein